MIGKKLHPTQKQILDFLIEHRDESPTIRDVQDALSISSTSVVYHHLRKLEFKGYIKRNPYNPRDFQILKGADRELAYLNLYGLAGCGEGESIADGDPISRI